LTYGTPCWHLVIHWNTCQYQYFGCSSKLLKLTG